MVFFGVLLAPLVISSHCYRLGLVMLEKEESFNASVNRPYDQYFAALCADLERITVQVEEKGLRSVGVGGTSIESAGYGTTPLDRQVRIPLPLQIWHWWPKFRSWQGASGKFLFGWWL